MILNVIKYSVEKRKSGGAFSAWKLNFQNKKIINKIILKKNKAFLPFQVEFRWGNFRFLKFKKT